MYVHVGTRLTVPLVPLTYEDISINYVAIAGPPQVVAVRDEAAEAEIVVEVLELCEGGTDDRVVGRPTEGVGRGLASRSDPEVLLLPVYVCVK